MGYYGISWDFMVCQRELVPYLYNFIVRSVVFLPKQDRRKSLNQKIY